MCQIVKLVYTWDCAISPIIEGRERSPVKSRGENELKEKRGAISQGKISNKSEVGRIRRASRGSREEEQGQKKEPKTSSRRVTAAVRQGGKCAKRKREQGQSGGGARKEAAEASKTRRERLKAIERVSPMMVALKVLSRPNQGERLR
jgi:hypothetical protein